MACSNRQTSQMWAVGETGFGWLCVDVVMCVYRRIYYCFLIYRGNRLPIYIPFKTLLLPASLCFLKTDQTPQADAPNTLVSFLNTFFLCFKEKSISVCITVLYYILILIVHFSKSICKQFAKNSTSFVHINKSTKSSIPSLLQTFFKQPFYS